MAKRPALRYFGGKWRLALWIVSNFPDHKIYTEPYGGGASVLLRKERSYAEVYNDIDSRVVNLFKVLRDEKQNAKLEKMLRLTPFARDEFKNAYKISKNPVENARRLIILSFMGFGADAVSGIVHTGFRANSNRSGTTPAHDWKNYPDALQGFKERLSGVIIENRNALDIIRQHDKEKTLHYLDPPYPHSVRSKGSSGSIKRYANEMSDDDHRLLAELLHQVQGMVVISSYRCGLYDEELFPEWNSLERKHYADGAKERTEVLYFNDAAWRKLSIGRSVQELLELK